MHTDTSGTDMSAWRNMAQEIMNSGPGGPGPQGVPGALSWTVSADAGHTWELVIDPATNTVLHFNYESN